MAIEHINEFDTLNAGREKINKHAIDPANRAELNSIDAKSIANQANQASQNAEAIAINTDDRLDNIIAGEMQDAEVIDARKPFGSEAYATLGERLDSDKAEVTAQLAQTATQLDSEGINILTPPSPLVGVIQGEEDSSTKINNMINYAFANGLTNIVIPVDVNITNTIFCKQGVNLIWKNNAVLYVMANVNAIDYNKNVVLDNPRVSSFNFRGYTKALIYLDGNKRISTAPHRTQINNPQLWGWSLDISGYGIHVYGGNDVTSDKLSYIEVNNPKISFLDKAIFIDVELGKGYANAFMFNNLLFSNNHTDIHLISSNANIFNNIISQDNIAVVGIILEGSSYNQFNGLMVYDLKTVPFVTLDERSKNNVLTTVDLDHRAIYDVGVNNIIRTNIGKSVDFYSQQIPNKMNGNQDDFLLYADKNKDFTFTMIQGRAPNGGVVVNMFRPDTTVVRWDAPASEERFIFEIDFGKVISLGLLGIDFTYVAKYIKLDVYNTTNTWVTVRESNDNQTNLFKFVSDYGSSAHTNMSKIRITIGDPLKNIADRIEIKRMFGYSNQEGKAYLSVGGGRVYGRAIFDTIGVGNSDTVPPVGEVKGRFRVFDENGNPIGYVPLY